MPSGRPSATSLDPADPGPVQQAVVTGTQHRLGLPARLTDGLAWFAPHSHVLLVLEEPGRGRILQWETHAPSILAERTTLLAAATETAYARVRLLEDRYQRLHVSSESRITLLDVALVHFDLPLDKKAQLTAIAVRYPTWVELLSVKRRNDMIESAHEEFIDLP